MELQIQCHIPDALMVFCFWNGRIVKSESSIWLQAIRSMYRTVFVKVLNINSTVNSLEWWKRVFVPIEPKWESCDHCNLSSVTQCLVFEFSLNYSLGHSIHLIIAAFKSKLNRYSSFIRAEQWTLVADEIKTTIHVNFSMMNEIAFWLDSIVTKSFQLIQLLLWMRR